MPLMCRLTTRDEAVLAIAAIVVVSGCDGNGAAAGLISHKPAVPVVVSHRISAGGGSVVAILSNQTSNRLTVRVEVTDKAGKRNAVNVDLDPNGRSELGWFEGFPFTGGETMTLSHPNYSSTTVKMNF